MSDISKGKQVDICLSRWDVRYRVLEMWWWGGAKTETVVNPKDIAEETLGTDETKVKNLKADVKPKLKQKKELEG